MPILAKYPKQPADVQDYDVDFSDYCNGFTPPDTLFSQVVTAEPGITLSPAPSRAGNVVKVWVTGGTSGVSYKVTVLATTNAGRKKEVEFVVKVKED